ncbi:spore gernimation protein GerPA [Gordoniibacillus kamchatkensis]|uniref:Spore gernimation protein GerPA n=1 Tax=Gordoniibacillus kamchatkensis TaxID=1590651 RepID=A0ABR5ADZ2_9BACL|nr:spore germination protein [Paenibacillus sp. VKM B-2647]KIL39269.1 spore gernimation protein GerPA [Paenibacillus sp. VKM B-2647]
MPAIVGNVKIISVGPSSVVHFGDSILIAPVSTTKTYAGAGSFNTGDFPRVFNGTSTTNVSDQDVVDSSPAKVATVA